MPRIIVFDVNETLLDLAALDPYFERAFGDTTARKEWFAQMLRTAFVSVITDRYTDFGTIGRAALTMRLWNRTWPSVTSVDNWPRPCDRRSVCSTRRWRRKATRSCPLIAAR